MWHDTKLKRGLEVGVFPLKAIQNFWETVNIQSMSHSYAILSVKRVCDIHFTIILDGTGTMIENINKKFLSPKSVTLWDLLSIYCNP